MTLYTSTDSSIAFTSSISSISPFDPDAEELQLRCGLNDSVVEDGPTSSGNITQLHSIAITRRPHEVIAVIMDFLPAKALADVDVVQVDGDISGTSGDKGSVLKHRISQFKYDITLYVRFSY